MGVALAIATAGDDERLRIDLGVVPGQRRRGVGRDLLGHVVSFAEATGRELLIADTYESVPAGAAFATSLGAQAGLANHVNRLLTARVDREQLHRWISEGPRRAPDYELLTVDGQCPEELADGLADVLNVIHDAPQGAIDTYQPEITAPILRLIEETQLGRGDEIWRLLARHRSSGLIVGETDGSWNPNRPTQVGQGTTVVRRQHRGYALGKWLKAVMLQRILDERPTVTSIVTSNADTNDAMVGINHQLGFQPYLATTTWQASTDRLSAALAVTRTPDSSR